MFREVVFDELTQNQKNILKNLAQKHYCINDTILREILLDLVYFSRELKKNNPELKADLFSNHISYLYSNSLITNNPSNLINLSKITYFVLLKYPTIKGISEFLANFHYPRIVSKAMYCDLTSIDMGFKAYTDRTILDYLSLAKYKEGDDSVEYAVKSLNLIADMDKVSPVIDINRPNKSDDTPLHNASWNGEIEIVKVLLKFHHININVRDVNYNDSALDMAIKTRNFEIARLLEEKGALKKVFRNNRIININDILDTLKSPVTLGQFKVLPIDNGVYIFVKEYQKNYEYIQVQLIAKTGLDSKSYVNLPKETQKLADDLLEEKVILSDVNGSNSNLAMIIPKTKIGKEHERALNENKKTKLLEELKNELKDFFNLDNKTKTISKDIVLLPPDKQYKISNIFFRLSQIGFAAEATNYAILLKSNGILSDQVDGDGFPVAQNTRIETFQREFNQFKTLAPVVSQRKRDKIRYWDRFNFDIYTGFKHFRLSHSKVRTYIENEDSDNDSAPIHDPKLVFDSAYTPSQINDYNLRKDSIIKLYAEGELFIRVTDSAEIIKFAGFQYQWVNTCLSTSLLPKEDSIVNMKLFNEGKEAIGILIDPNRASKKDFGATYYCNAFTKSNGFEIQGYRGNSEHYASNSWMGQKELLDQIDKNYRAGYSIKNQDLILTKKMDGSGWISRPTILDYTLNSEIDWNETTWYRGAQRDLAIGLFIKKDHIDYSDNLRKLIKTQSLIRRKKGLYFPIFHIDGKKNKLREIIVDAMLIALLGISDTVKASPQTETSLLTNELKRIGLNVDIVSQAVQTLSTSNKLKKYLEILIMSLSMSSNTETVSITNDTNSFTDIRLVDNLHLLFAGSFKTAKANAIMNEFCLETSDIKLIKSNQNVLNLFKSIAKRNLHFFLGVEITDNNQIVFDKDVTIKFNTNDSHYIDYSRALTRALKSMNEQGYLSAPIIKSILVTIRKDLPSLGYEFRNATRVDHIYEDIFCPINHSEGKFDEFTFSDDDLESVSGISTVTAANNYGIRYNSGPRFSAPHRK